MTIIYFEGAAGTGKTTNIVGELQSKISQNPLTSDQRVLGLTFMHGARKRLEERVNHACTQINKQFICRTIDSFAWELLSRWRQLARSLGMNPMQNDFDTTCQYAAQLLHHQEVRKWVGWTFPFIIIDEMQDCKAARLEILQLLSQEITLLACADEFQDLSGEGENEAVMWLRVHGEVTSLNRNYRTNISGLLEAAGCLRNGESFSNGMGLTILNALNKNVAASFIATNINWWRAFNDTVILSPTSPVRSRFASDTIERLKSPIRPNRLNRDVGPYYFPWESTPEKDKDTLTTIIGLPSDGEVVVEPRDLDLSANQKGIDYLKNWFENQLRLKGRTSFTNTEILLQIDKSLQQLRTNSRTNESGFKAMTIHQAKNREFNHVIILWPYEVTNSPERLRRLMYNAVTRAKQKVLIIVQGPSTRLNSPPFS
jgi:hypothetical protein